MIRTYEELLERIGRGDIREHRFANVELKEDWRRDYGEDLSALANKTHVPEAWLVVGVTNTGALRGHSEKWAEQQERVISDHINERLDPSQACKGIRCHKFEGGWVIAVQVSNPGSVVRWGPEAYLASGTTSRSMTVEEVAELAIRLPGLTDYSKQPWNGGVDESLVEQFVADVKSRHPEAIKEPAGFPSAALAILGIREKNVSRILFGDCKYRVVTYDDSGSPVAHEQHPGLYRLLTPAFAESIQRSTAERLGLGAFPYPPRALKEAVANAVAHAAYFERDGDVIAEVYPDRLVIGNLCAAESRYFANRWFSRSRRTLNVLLMEMLRLAGKVDELGLGKNLIFRESIMAGKRPPTVTLETAGVYSRWKLSLPGGTRNERQVRLLERLSAHYGDPSKALMANALVLWRHEPVSKIRQYVDDEYLPVFAELLDDVSGPTFYYEPEDRIVLSRWASVLLGEGKDSKKLSVPEETNLLTSARALAVKYHDSYMTSRQLREWAHMGETRSEKSLSSTLLRSWVAKKYVTKVKPGLYRFTEEQQKIVHMTEGFSRLLDMLIKKAPSS